MSQDHDLAAQQAAEEHISACWAWLNDEGEEPEGMGLYCGCLTCEVREILTAAYPHLKAGWEAEREEQRDAPPL